MSPDSLAVSLDRLVANAAGGPLPSSSSSSSSSSSAAAAAAAGGSSSGSGSGSGGAGAGWGPGGAEAYRRSLLLRSEVVCTTLAGAGMDLLLDFTMEHRTKGDVCAFDVLVVDEATQATEPDLLVALRHCPPHVVLVGDHMQLPPTVLSHGARHAGLGVSTFERLVLSGRHVQMLTEQYRMHPCLSAFPSAHFYRGQLVDRVTAAARRAPLGFPWPDHARPLAVLAVTEGRESGGVVGRKRPIADDDDDAGGGGGGGRGGRGGGGMSLANLAEAEAIVAAVQRLLAPPLQPPPHQPHHQPPHQPHHELPPPTLRASDIGVITFYRAQAEAIRERLCRAHCGDVECSTVDGFQGREKDVVLLSCVRAQPGGAADAGGGARGGGPSHGHGARTPNLGFLHDGRRVNVALTRAKRGLIIACHPPTLRRALSLSATAARGAGGGEPRRPDGGRCLAELVQMAESERLVVAARDL